MLTGHSQTGTWDKPTRQLPIRRTPQTGCGFDRIQRLVVIPRRYERIKPVSGRLPSRELALHLEEHERELRFFDPAVGNWIPTLQESREAAEAERRQAVAKWQRAEAEVELLRQELETLRRQVGR